MSVEVAVEDLPEELATRALAYLVTTGDHGAKVVAVDVVADGPTLTVIGTGPGSRAQAAARPAVTLVFPPVALDGMTLLVDGEAHATEGDELTVVPHHGVLHRPAPSLRSSR